MIDLQNHLITLSDEMDKKGKINCANSIDKIIRTASLFKLAQYVGVIGYVLKQNRAIANCLRKKRVASNRSMQEVTLECLKEYQDGQNYQQTEWASKYAQLIQQCPDKFNSSHLSLIAEIREANNIDEHLQSANALRNQLEGEGESDETINEIVDHVASLHAILSREEDSTLPFKVAAPRSKRKWWQRIFSPSWTRSGQEKDVETELSNILEGIRTISLSIQQIKSSLKWIKSAGIQSILSLLQHNKDPDDATAVQTIVTKIGVLDEETWSKFIYGFQDIVSTVEMSRIKSPYITERINHLRQYIIGIEHSANSVYNAISKIQTNMYNLRQRNLVRGTSSLHPANEFEQLERVLERLYRNPFDEQSAHYAQRAHSRLESRIHAIDIPSDEELQGFVSSPYTPDHIDMTLPELEMPNESISQERQQNVTTTTPTPQSIEPQVSESPAETQTNIDSELIKSIVNNLSQGDTSQTLDNLSVIHRTLDTPQTQALKELIGTIIDRIIEEQERKQITVPTPQTETAVSPISFAKTENIKNLSPAEIEFRARNNGQGLEQLENAVFNELKGIKHKKLAADVILNMIKLADIMDQRHSDMADLIDKYLETRHLDQEFF